MSYENGWHQGTRIQAIKFVKLWRVSRLWHDSDSNIVLLSRQDANSLNYGNVFSLKDLGRNCYGASVNLEFDSALARRLKLISCRATVEPDCNLARHGRSRTSELGQRLRAMVQ